MHHNIIKQGMTKTRHERMPLSVCLIVISQYRDLIMNCDGRGDIYVHSLHLPKMTE